MVFVPGVDETSVQTPTATAAVQESTPSDTMTLPVGVPVDGAAGDTVQVTGYPMPAVVEEEANSAAFEIRVIESALLTVCGPPVNVPVLPSNDASPLYMAAMTGLPGGSVETVHKALDPATVTFEQIGSLSAVKVTVPVGVPAPGAMTLNVAVNVTGCPATDGLSLEVTTVAVWALVVVCVPPFARSPLLGLKFESPL